MSDEIKNPSQSVTRFDRGAVKGDASITDEGYIRARAVVTRTGVFLYQNPDGTIRRELRHPDDVWHADSIASMQLIPITNNHPIEKLVTAENSKRLKIGHTGETIQRDDPHVIANIVITDQDGVDAIRKFGRKELSLGYTVDLDETPGVYQGEQYDAKQTNIRYNHLAIVDRARAGSEARIALDSCDAVEILNEEKIMASRKIKIDADEVLVEETAANYIERLERDLRNLRDERDRVIGEIRMIEDKLEKAEGERDASKELLNTAQERLKEVNVDSESFKKAVADRIKLYKTAESHLDAADLTKLDSLSDADIKKLVIKSCRKSINLDGKSPAYLEAMFDTILDDQSKKSVNTQNVSYKLDARADTGSDPSTARSKMIESMKTAHQKPATAGGK